MAFEPIDPRDVKPGEHYMTTTSGRSGHFAVDVWVNNQEPDLGPFQEPWDTGIGRYRTKAEACVEAWRIAEAKNMPYSLRYTPGMPEFNTALRVMARKA